MGIGLIFQAHAIQQFQGFCTCPLLVIFFDLQRCQRDIFYHRHIGKEVEVLKHHTNVFAHLVEINVLIGQVETA